MRDNRRRLAALEQGAVDSALRTVVMIGEVEPVPDGIDRDDPGVLVIELCAAKTDANGKAIEEGEQ
jgi:hypothetical protein